MILTDFYKGEHLPDAAKTRYDITASTQGYVPFETMLKNRKRGLSFYLVMCLTGGIFPAKTGLTRQFQRVIIFPVSLCQM